MDLLQIKLARSLAELREVMKDVQRLLVTIEIAQYQDRDKLESTRYWEYLPTLKKLASPEIFEALKTAERTLSQEDHDKVYKMIKDIVDDPAVDCCIAGIHKSRNKSRPKSKATRNGGETIE